jgi:predicted deacylase
VGDYQRSFSATIRGAGIVADMNRGFGGSEEPAEVALLRRLVDELEPGLVIDLHEGQGSTYYVFVGADSPHPGTVPYARAALAAMGADGDDPVTLDDLERAFGPRIREGLVEPEPGMMVGRVQNVALDGTSFGNYCDRFCPAITTETGRWAPLADRVRWQLAAARAVLAAHEAPAPAQGTPTATGY